MIYNVKSGEGHTDSGIYVDNSNGDCWGVGFGAGVLESDCSDAGRHGFVDTPDVKNSGAGGLFARGRGRPDGRGVG